MNEINTNISCNVVLNLLDTNPAKGADLLIDFARQRSGDRGFHKKSILLKSMFNMIETEDEKLNVVLQMKTLLREISELPGNEHAEEPGTDPKRAFFLQRGTSKKIIIECENICKSYPADRKGNRGFKLDDINLSLRLGEINGLVGENGNGKTTLLKIISGELLPDSGLLNYRLDEKMTGKTNWPLVKKQIAYLPQELPFITGEVVQTLRITAAIHNIRGMKNKLETDYIIYRMGLADHANKKWKQLSGGYKLRFALAKLLIRKPKVIVLDEPLANLDINTQNSLLNDLRDIGRSISNPVCIILSSQHLEEVESIADNMILLSEGQIKYNGPTSAIGNLRTENTFEIKSPFTKEQIKERLASFNYKNIKHTGFSFLISTRLNVDMDSFTRHLMEKNIPVTYLCDISNSTKKMILNSNKD